MPKRESIIPSDMQNIHERFHYSPGVKAGNLLFIAGQVGRDEHLQVVEGKEAQFVQAFENVKKVRRCCPTKTIPFHFHYRLTLLS